MKENLQNTAKEGGTVWPHICFGDLQAKPSSVEVPQNLTLPELIERFNFYTM